MERSEALNSRVYAGEWIEGGAVMAGVSIEWKTKE